MGKGIRRIPGEELKKLMEYHWPGNVRELKHLIERAVILSDGRGITFSSLLQASAHRATGDASLLSLADVERDHIEKVLNATHWKVSGPSGAASILGLKPTNTPFPYEQARYQKTLFYLHT